MREQEYRARGKVVQKMTRDGLSEKNLADGTGRGISQRTADFAFRGADSGDREATGRPESAGGRQENTTGRPGRQAPMRQANKAGDTKMLAPAVQENGAVGDREISTVLPDRDVPGESGSTKQFSDSRNFYLSHGNHGERPRIVGEQGKRKTQREQAENWRESNTVSHYRDANTGDIGASHNLEEAGCADTGFHRQGTDWRREGAEAGNPAAYEPELQASGIEESAIHKRDDMEFGRTAHGTEAAEAGKPAHGTRTGKLVYGTETAGDEKPGRGAETTRAGKSARGVEATGAGKSVYDTEAAGVEKPGRASEAAEAGKSTHGSEAAEARKSVRDADAAGSEKVSSGPETSGEEKSARRPEDQEAGSQKNRAYRRLEKAEKRLGDANDKLEKAKKKLPTRHRLKLEPQEDPDSQGKRDSRKGQGAGRKKSRLRFEAEPIPEKQEPSLLKRTGGGLVHTAQTAAISKVHREMREAGRDNVSVESADKAAAVAERAGSRAYRTVRNRLRSRPYRAVKYAEKEVLLAEQNVAYRKFLAENPETQKKALAKLAQKQKVKRQYAAAARKAVKGAGNTAKGAAATGKTAKRITEHLKSGKAVLIAIIIVILAFAMAGSLFSAGSSMLMGTGSAVASACYLAEETDINQSELHYTELETDLQLEIANTEWYHPGYDEYRYNIGEIGHNPYELLGYLSATFDDFTYAQVEAELNRLFGLQYELTREFVTETRTYLDEEGEEQEYEWKILKTVLSVRPLSGILSDSLPSGDPAERYSIYMQTCGGRQNFGSPFDFSCLGYVTSPYGYRVHPISGGKNLHRGIDIAAAEGTPILAVQDGRVASAGDAGGYGLCLVIEGEDGYQSRYAHCSSIAVSTGQEVRRGDVVAYVGNTGDSTGPHLHLEAVHNGEYLNPYFFVENGGGGFSAAGNAAASVSFSADPGEPMGEVAFRAMLEVAERYLGYPYVWGGSTPETSFDCSGYVSYVINQSGVGSVGRQTAQGLCNLCTPVPWEELQPGDLVFFTGTYSSATPVSHVGIYVGGGRMINAGDPIGYADVGNSRYWKGHFYCGGRLP